MRRYDMSRRRAWDDPQIRSILLQCLRSGMSRPDACRAAKVSYQAMLGWIDHDPKVEQAIVEAERSNASPSRSESDPKRKTVGRWEKMLREAEAIEPGIMGIILWIDALLVSKGFHPMPQWWVSTLRRFYKSGKRWLLLRVGRRGGKSSTLCRVAVAEGIFVKRKIGPGDIGIWSVFSVDRAEATGRLVMIKSILDALGIKYEESNEFGRQKIITEDASGNHIEFRVYPATVGAASGFTGIGNTDDEEAKWKDEKTGANPATEVLRAVRPTLGTLSVKEGMTEIQAHGFRCSSAFSEHGTHYDDVQKGDTKLHHVATIGEEFLEEARAALYLVADAEESEDDARAIREYADSLTADSPNVPTFLANPTQDPIEKRIDEPDLATFLREYGSKPLSCDASGFFDSGKIDKCKRLSFSGAGVCFAGIDTGSKRNAFALAIVKRIELDDGWVFIPVFLKEWIPSPGNPLDLRNDVLPEAARICKRYNCDSWWTDAYAGDQVEIVGNKRDIATIYVSSDPYTECYRDARNAIYRGQVPLSGCKGCDELVKQLKRVTQAHGDGGRIKIMIPADGALHGDLGVAFIRALGNAGVGEYKTEDGETITVESRYGEVIGIGSRYA